MPTSPFVSFILISYRHKNFIKDCLESILAQTYSNMEILYLDDASGDGTYQAAETYKAKLEAKFGRVEYIENPANQGLVKNLNKLVRMCRGKYVKLLAADDFMLPDGIEKLTGFMENHPEYDMVYSNGISGDKNSHFPLRNIAEYECLYQGEQISGSAVFQSLYKRDFIYAPTVMLRYTIYDKIGLYDESIGVEDWDYYLRIAKEGNIGYLSEPTIMYRVLTSSMSHSSDAGSRKNMKKSVLQILEKHKEGVENADFYIDTNFNDALQDAFHIDDREYLAWLYAYADRNGVQVRLQNRIKMIAYKLGIIRILDGRRSW